MRAAFQVQDQEFLRGEQALIDELAQSVSERLPGDFACSAIAEGVRPSSHARWKTWPTTARNVPRVSHQLHVVQGRTRGGSRARRQVQPLPLRDAQRGGQQTNLAKGHAGAQVIKHSFLTAEALTGFHKSQPHGVKVIRPISLPENHLPLVHPYQFHFVTEVTQALAMLVLIQPGEGPPRR